MPSLNLNFVSWNILADGMSRNEFVTNGGDHENTLWSSRCFRITSILQKFLKDQVQVIGLQENDHPYFILNEIQKIKPEMRCVHLYAKGASRSAEKLRIDGIFDYLKSSDNDFQNLTLDLDKREEQNYDRLYSKINQWYKTTPSDQIKNKFTITSFKEENAEIFAKVLNRNPDDLYIVNDGITLYYDSNVLEFTGPVPSSQMTATDCPTFFMGKDLACRFKILDSNVTSENKEPSFINIFCTHLKSGEGLENEKRRVEQMSVLLELANDLNEPSVILLDSNTSNLYREEIQKFNQNETNLLDIAVKEFGFQNIIPTKGNECFKMRHAQGEQPNKFGNLMFDTIDKILIKTQWCVDFKCIFPDWLKVLPTEYYDEVLSWRTDETKRNELKRMCCENKWGDDVNKNHIGDNTFNRSIFYYLYPNQEMPSDHPPVMANITFRL